MLILDEQDQGWMTSTDINGGVSVAFDIRWTNFGSLDLDILCIGACTKSPFSPYPNAEPSFATLREAVAPNVKAC